jgi:photosystem II stability/assembly factor-like uncharacterized protein
MTLSFCLFAVALIGLTACAGPYNYGSATFTDDQHGWVTGWDPTKSKTVLLTTADGGTTWTRVGARSTADNGNVRIAGWAEFSTPTTGVWAVTKGSPLYTTTGGRPWTRSTTRDGGGIRSMNTAYYSAASFANAAVGWATLVRGQAATAAASTGGYIVKTRDAGAHWRIKKSVKGEKGDGGFADVAALSARACCALRAGARGGVYVTSDNGATWKRYVLPTDSTAYEALDFIDAMTGWVVGDGGMIAKTTDGGVTWTPQSSGVDVRLHGVCFVDANLGWAAGEYGTIVTTQDGGATWTPQVSGWIPDPAVEDDNMVLNDVDFVSATEGWIVQDIGWTPGQEGTVLHTVDGGATWQITH